MWQPYPKSFFKVGCTIPDIITNIIFFAFYFSFLVGIVSRFNLPSKRQNSKKVYIKHLILLFVVQVFLDSIRMLAGKFLPAYEILVCDFFTILSWSGFIWICVDENISIIPQRKRQCWLTILSGITILSIITFLDFKDIFLLQKDLEKYGANGSFFLQHSQNTAFLWQIRNALLDTAIGCILFINLYLSQRKILPKRKRAVTIFAQVLVSLWSGIIISGLKLSVLPHSALAEFNISTASASHSINNKLFFLGGWEIEISRAIDYSTNALCYYSAINEIWYADTKLLTFYTGEPLTVDTIDIGVHSIRTYNYKAIAYILDGAPHSLLLENLKFEPYNQLMLDFCKKIVNGAQWHYFEPCCEYLMKYDKDFIMPFLVRYSEGLFTDKELSENAEIQPQFVHTISKKMIEAIPEQ